MSRYRNVFLPWLPMVLVFCALSVGAEPAPVPRVFQRDAILTMMLKTNAYQQAHPVMKENDRNWERGTWYTGVMAAYRATGDERFLQQAREWGKRHAWQVGTERCGANKLFCVQTWLELYALQKNQATLQPTIEHLASDVPNSPGGTQRWYLEGDHSYADSLYGSPALVQLYRPRATESTWRCSMLSGTTCAASFSIGRRGCSIATGGSSGRRRRQARRSSGHAATAG